MPSFEEYVAAMQARDTIKALVRAEMAAQRPEYRYGTVQSIDRQARECTVQFPEGGDPVTVQMGSLQPTYVGQVVRVDGLNGDRFVSDVIGESYNYRNRPEVTAKHIFFGVGGAGVGLSGNGWNNLIVNNAAYFACYDQSAGANGNYKEQSIFLEPGYWHIYTFILKGPNIGNIQVTVDGVQIGSILDGYNSTYTPAIHYYGYYTALDAGWHTVRVTINGKNASSSSYYGLLSSLLFNYGGALA